MLVSIPSKLDELAPFLTRFLEIAGAERWFKRCDQLDADQRRSPFRWKIVSDYHWLEMALGYQADVLAKEGRLLPELVDGLILASLNFAATAAEVHVRLSPKGRQVFEGRLRDSLKAETGFAPLYLELDLAQRLMDAGYDVEFADMEGAAQYDLLFSRGAFAGEVECKSLSADAGRQIHRKDFYRFMEAIAPALTRHAEQRQREVLLITLDARLPSNTPEQASLVKAVAALLDHGTRRTAEGGGFHLELRSFAESLGSASLTDQKAFYKACGKAFGQNTHVAGSLTEDGGCLVVMRSSREDDPSKPQLEAMRKAATQFTGDRPAFIAIQEHGIEPADLMLPHVRRRAGILSYALFGHYGAAHVNAVYVTGFGAVVARDGQIGTPAFAVPNPVPKFAISPEDAAPFLVSISDADYATAIGAPLPAPNISHIPVDPEPMSEGPTSPP
ncbi:MAG TPA: hypothetical protein VGU24_18555 [Microvirga sp.]|jgi:hypothetical protein|nr:hypothetical protein [Microvirga sp.]